MKSVGNNLSPKFVQTILQSASPFLAIRKSHSEQVSDHSVIPCKFLTEGLCHLQVLQGIMDCLQGLLALSSKPIQAATYESVAFPSTWFLADCDVFCRAVVSDLSMAVEVIQTGLKAAVSSADGRHGTGTLAAELSPSEAEGLVIFDLHVLCTVIHNSSVQKTSSPSVQVVQLFPIVSLRHILFA